MTILENLKAARAIIKKPEHWAKYALAYSKLGHPTDAEDPDAECFCAIGAMRRAYINAGAESVSAAIQAGISALVLANVLFKRELSYTLPTFNDLASTTHADILKLFDDAIAECENRGP